LAEFAIGLANLQESLPELTVRIDGAIHVLEDMLAEETPAPR